MKWKSAVQKTIDLLINWQLKETNKVKHNFPSTDPIRKKTVYFVGNVWIVWEWTLCNSFLE